MNFDVLKTKSVLYVEDEESIMRSFSTVLKKLFKDVYLASDGVEGLKLFKEHQDVDFVITDIRMPNMDGLEMAKEIKDISPNTPCLLTTAHGEYEYFLQAEEIGIYRYITKPLNITELMQTLADF
ncbi:MAG: response regulator [Campylobacterota bacterium]|nr:response regulator [Campylobacterota bacterium]